MAKTPDRPPRMPVPERDRTALRHAFRVGQLPKTSGHIQHACAALRRKLEDAVIAARGEVSLSDAAFVSTAIRWEVAAQMSMRWLRNEGDSLPMGERVRAAETIAKASDARDRAIRMLALDHGADQDLFATLGNGGTDE